ncbi:MAG: hypothetical protein RPU63_01875 [Candidatus Sedimenticola sp. (ex Thyasira tokunagai)]
MIRTYNMANGELLQQQYKADATKMPERHPVDISYPTTQLQEVILESEQRVDGMPADLAQVAIDQFLDQQ